MDNKRDVVKEYIELNEEIKEAKKKLGALKVVVLDDHKDDPRITIVQGRKIYTINPDVYEKLEQLGYKTEEKITRQFEFKDFSKEVQDLILSNEDNYDVKEYNPSIRIKKRG